MGLPCLTPLLAVALVATGMPETGQLLMVDRKMSGVLSLFFAFSGAKPTQKEEGTLFSGWMMVKKYI